MHWNEVEREREMGYRDAYLHANGESGLGACERAGVLVGAVQYTRPRPTRLRETPLAVLALAP